MGGLIVNGVTFVEKEVMKLSREAFIEQNINVFWKELPRKKREDRLNIVYDKIIGKKMVKGVADE